MTEWQRGSSIMVDTSCINYVDILDVADKVDKAISSGVVNIDELRERLRYQALDTPFSQAHFMTKNYDLAENLLKQLPNATVHFVNEDCFKTSSAFLIDKAGYRNKRSGLVGTYEHHSLIIVNYGTKRGKDILDFMKEIQKDVHSQFHIWLEPEVRIY